jgi:hypothetical protein
MLNTAGNVYLALMSLRVSSETETDRAILKRETRQADRTYKRDRQTKGTDKRYRQTDTPI